MKLIVGLGNPGKQFDRTPHNAGFEFVDLVKSHLEQQGLRAEPWSHLKKEEAEISEIYDQQGKRIVVLAKPQTFMNLSGKAVQLIMNKFGIKNRTDILIAYDELDIALGNFKYSPIKNSRTHKGINSVIGTVGKDVHSIRIGIDNRNKRPISGEDYVLMPYSLEEYATLKRACKDAIDLHLNTFLVQNT